MAYAENTTVPVEKSIGEIVAMAKKRGAQRVAQYEEPTRFLIQFELDGRLVRFSVPFVTTVDITGKRGARPPSNSERIASAERRNKQRARALLLVIKAKFESIESEVETFEEAFLPNVVMADGKTVYERIAEPLALEYREGKPQPMLLGGPGR